MTRCIELWPWGPSGTKPHTWQGTAPGEATSRAHGHTGGQAGLDPGGNLGTSSQGLLGGFLFLGFICSVSLPRWPQWPGWGQAEGRSFIWVSFLGVMASVLRQVDWKWQRCRFYLVLVTRSIYFKAIEGACFSV